MAKYRVKTIAMSIRGNKIARSGEILDSSQLINENDAVEGGYVELLSEKDLNVEDPEEVINYNPETEDEDPETEEEETEDEDPETEEEETEDEYGLEDMTKKELISFAHSNEIEIDEKAKKPVIKQLIKDHL